MFGHEGFYLKLLVTQLNKKEFKMVQTVELTHEEIVQWIGIFVNGSTDSF